MMRTFKHVKMVIIQSCRVDNPLTDVGLIRGGEGLESGAPDLGQILYPDTLKITTSLLLSISTHGDSMEVNIHQILGRFCA